MKIFHVVGARPNFMKAAPVVEALAHRPGVTQKLIHTGQHYDPNMSDVFFEQLGLPNPDWNLGAGSGSHAQQTAEIMLRFERLLLEDKPDLLLVYGDVNSTIATALVACKMGVRIGHVEAGRRSRDRSMPEEINRVLTDRITDLFFTPSAEAGANLEQEGVSRSQIFHVGNVMIDSLVKLLPAARAPHMPGRTEAPFVLVTLHRPSNVDDRDALTALWQALRRVSRQWPVIFPIHPRTRRRLAEYRLAGGGNDFLVTDPLGYFEFLWLQQHATVVVTDSGGIQEETTYLGVPCLTMRDNTERPETVELGTNILIGQDTARLEREIANVLDGRRKHGRIPPLWDGRAGERIANIIADGSAIREKGTGSGNTKARDRVRPMAGTASS